MKILLTVDGSDHSRLAVKHVVKHWAQFAPHAALELVHVDPPLTPRVAAALGQADTKRFHDENARDALRYARSYLHKIGIAFAEHCLVGDPAELIAHLATRGRYDLLVMGSHGRGVLRNLLLGSVVAKVLQSCRTPLLIVR
ncbi:MAG TPA: universal stress protein [Tahibacter sp.]|uniref:universal stress protein n=1 Tax=Tahibacter sp. TaxID=2056211 RepID=UPI002C0DEA25|nr:universal stress protein [Tahibacter sp.]HSX60033.1 universal stress protein [Tahibacter sp.]